MEKIVDVNVCENMLDQALIENENMAEKIELQEELIAKQEAEIEIQKKQLSELKGDLSWANEEIDRLEHDIEILKAQMDVVRMIFGGRGNE